MFELNQKLLHKLDNSNKTIIKSKGKYFTSSIIDILELYLLIFYDKEIDLSNFFVNFTETFKEQIISLNDFKFLETMPEIYEKFKSDSKHKVFRVVVVLLFVEIFGIPVKFYQIQPPNLTMKNQVLGQGRLSGDTLQEMICQREAAENPRLVKYVKSMVEYLGIPQARASQPRSNLDNCRIGVFAFEDSVGFGLLRKEFASKGETLEANSQTLEELEQRMEHRQYVDDVLDKLRNPGIVEAKHKEEFNLSILKKLSGLKRSDSNGQNLERGGSEEDLFFDLDQAQKRKNSLKNLLDLKRRDQAREKEKEESVQNRIGSLDQLESIISHDLSDKETEKSRPVPQSMNNLSLYIRDTISKHHKKRKSSKFWSKRKSPKSSSKKWAFSRCSCSCTPTSPGGLTRNQQKLHKKVDRLRSLYVLKSIQMKSYLAEFYERQPKKTVGKDQQKTQNKAFLELMHSPIEKNSLFMGMIGHKGSFETDQRSEFSAIAGNSSATGEGLTREPRKRGKKKRGRPKEPEKRKNKRRKNLNKGNKQKRRFVLVENTQYRKVDSCTHPKSGMEAKEVHNEQRQVMSTLNQQPIREHSIFDFGSPDIKDFEESSFLEKQQKISENRRQVGMDEPLNSSGGNNYLDLFGKEEDREQSGDESNGFKWPVKRGKEEPNAENESWDAWNEGSRARRLSLSEDEDCLLKKQEKDFLRQDSDTCSNAESDASNGGFHLVRGELGSKDKGFGLDNIEWGNQESLEMERDAFGETEKFKDDSIRKDSFAEKVAEGIGEFVYNAHENQLGIGENPQSKECFQDGLKQLEKRLELEKFGKMQDTRPEEHAPGAKQPDLLTNGFQVPFQQVKNDMARMHIQPNQTSHQDLARGHSDSRAVPSQGQMGFQGYMNYPPVYGHQMNQNFNMMPMPNYSGSNYLQPMMRYPNISQSWGMLPKSMSTSSGPSLVSKSLSQGFDKNEKLTGKLKFFNPDEKFGFLIKDDDQTDIFFHLTDMENSGIFKEILMGEKSCLKPSFECPHRIEDEYSKSVGVRVG